MGHKPEATKTLLQESVAVEFVTQPFILLILNFESTDSFVAGWHGCMFVMLGVVWWVGEGESGDSKLGARYSLEDFGCGMSGTKVCTNVFGAVKHY